MWEYFIISDFIKKEKPKSRCFKMKKGFALLETIIVITFVTVSLLLLYGTFTSMIDNREKNIHKLS